METVSFTRMADGSAEDYMLLERLEKQHAAGVADRVLGHLRGLEKSFGGYQVDRLEHSLQCASRAHRDGAAEELVVVALLHDIGDMLAPLNHSEMAAAILRPYVSEESCWIAKWHGLFQAYYYTHHLGGDGMLERDFGATRSSTPPSSSATIGTSRHSTPSTIPCHSRHSSPW